LKDHKTAHRGRQRTVFIGPKAQEIILPHILRAGRGRVFPLSRAGLRTAVERGCRRAFAHPELAKVPVVDLTDAQRAELASWNRDHHWHPSQLRHSSATEIRAKFDVDHAKDSLGHSAMNVTGIYAEIDASKARKVARQIG
jgi:integrase